MGITREEIDALPPDPDTARTHVLKAGDKVLLRERFLGAFRRLYPGLSRNTVYTIGQAFMDKHQTRYVAPGIGVARKSQLKWINPNPPQKRKRKKAQGN